jgi:autotransporter-associated beta strand protein
MPTPPSRARYLPMASLLAASLLGVGTTRASAANLYWDDGDGSWNLSTNWSTVAGATTPDPAGVPGSADIATFNVTGSATNETITLDAAQSVSGLVFASAGTVTLQSGAGSFGLTLGADGVVLNPSVGAVSIGVPVTLGAPQSWNVGVGSSLTVGGTLDLGGGLLTLPGAGSLVLNGLVSGSGGLTKSGTGFLSLTAANTFAGTTSISGGLVSISHGSALGTDASAISVTGSFVRTFGGGSLRLAGTYGAGLTLTRPLSLAGNGPITNGGVAFVSVGPNTLSGLLSTGVGAVNTTLTSVMAPLALTDLNVGGTANTTFSSFGTIGSALANFTVGGVLSGTGTIQKFGAGTLILAPTDASGFSGTFRVTSGTIRVLSAATFGTNTGSTTSAPLDLNGGILEFRVDGSASTGKNVYYRNQSTLFLDHAPGSISLNGTHAFGNLSYEVTNSYVFNGRNGTGASFTTAPVVTGDDYSTFTNNLNGLLTFTGAFWSNSNTAAARTLTLGGTGNTLISGSIIASGGASFDHVLVKSGTGTVTLSGVAATLDGATSVSSGPLVITDFRSLGGAANSTAINLGNTTTTAGVLTFGTSVTATAAGLSTASYPRFFNLNGTTGGATINASQSVALPVIISTNFTATGAGTKTLTLGGTNTSDNLISGAIVENSTTNKTNLAKTDAGTWVLSGANTFTGSTTISGGTLKLKATAAASDIIKETGAFIFGAQSTSVGQSAGGTAEFVGLSSAATTESLGALTLTNGGGTLKLTSGGGSFAANLIFASVGGTIGKVVGVNIDTAGAAGGTVTLTGAATGTATTMVGNGHLYLNGADFADVNGSAVVVAPTYSAAGAIWNSAIAGSDALVATKHNLVAGDQTAVATKTISSLKLGANTVTLAAGATLTVRLGAAGTEGPILQTGGSGVITGGTALSSGGAGALVIRVNGVSDQLTIGTPITTSTTGGWTKNGAGTLVFSAANTTTAGIGTINEGTVRLSGSGQLGGASLNVTLRQGATLDLGGASVTTGSFNGAGTVTNSSAAAATFTTQGGDTVSFTGLVRDGAGVINVTRTGSAGTGRWLGANTYSGVSTLNLGGGKMWEIDTLANYGSASTLGTGSSVSNASALVFTGTADSGLSYLGSASVSTDRLFTLNSPTAGTGGSFVGSNAANNATVVFANTGALAFGSNANSIAQIVGLGGTSTGDNYFGPLIQNSGGGLIATSVTKTGTGLWILGNSNTYTGPTNVNAGTLAAVPGVGLPASSPLVLNGGVLQMSGTFNRTLSATPTAGTGTVTLQAGASGFAAGATKLVVNLNGGGQVAFGANGFFSSVGADLALNSDSSLAELEFRNDLDLGATPHTFTVTDNTSTGADFVTFSGALSNGTDITVSASGSTLQLLGANTHTGQTIVAAGILAVNALGNSASPAGTGTSVGVSGAGTIFSSTNAVLLGNNGTTAGILQYVGPGETSDRMIQLRTTTGSTQILADGTGPLVLTNLLNSWTAGTKTLYLRGSNTQGNTISSILADNVPGTNTLSVMVDGGATWILSGANTYAGTTVVTSNSTYPSFAGGALGLGADNCLGPTSELQVRNGSVFAAGGDRVIANPLSNGSAATTYTAGFFGDYSLTFTGPNTMLNASVSHTLTNNIVAGKALTFTGPMLWNAMTSTRTLTVNGSGSTALANITTSTAFGLNITYAGTGVLTLAGTASNWNNGLVTVSAGTLRLGANEVIPDGAGKGNLTLAPAVGVTATFDLRGFAETINGLTATSAGNAVIDNSSATPTTLTIGAADTAATVGGGGGTFTVANTGAGALSLVKAGTASVTLPATGTTLNHRGATSVTGGTLVVAAPLAATTALSSTGAGSNLSVAGGLSAPSGIASFTVGGGAILSLLDGFGTPLAALTSLDLGAGTGTATVALELGATSDLLAVSTPAVVANTVRFNLNGISGLADVTTYNLITAPSGLSAGTYQLGSQPGGFTSGTLTVTDTLVSYTTGTAIISDTYWNNTQATGSWATNNAGLTNFTTDLAGATEGGFTPGPGSTVIFGTTNAAALAGSAFATTLDASFTVAGLRFTGNPSGVTSWSIAPGTPSTSTLTIRSAGIDVGANAGTVTLSAPLVLGADQSWAVDGTGANGSTLTIAAAIAGSGRSLTKTGNGVLNLAAASTFDGGLVVKAGTVIGTTTAAAFGAGSITLGDTTGSASAFLQSNTSALTFARPLILTAGTTGTLSVGTPVNAAAVNVTFSAGVTGANTLTVNNQSLSGTTIFSLQPVNHAGAFVNVGSSTGTVTISGGVGANVTCIQESSAAGALTVSTTALTVNAAGTTLANDSSTGKVLTLSAVTAGAGDLILQSAVTGVSSVILVSGAPNHVGRIINSGTGSAASNGASVVLSGLLGANLTGIVQDSATSPMSLSANNAAYAGGMLIKKGVLIGLTSSNSLGSASNVITIGDSSGSADATLGVQTDATFYPPQIVVAAGNTGVARLAGYTTTGQPTVTGAITLSSHDLSIENGGVGFTPTTSSLTVTGGITSTGTGGNVTLRNTATTTGTITLSGAALNFVGSLTNAGTAGTSGVTVSAPIGANVTGIIQNSATSPMTLSGVNASAGGVSVLAGTLKIANAASLGSGPIVGNGGNLDNNTGAAFTVGSSRLTIESSFGFVGTSSLDLGSIPVGLGASAGPSRTLSVNANTLTVGGTISDGTDATTPATSLTKAGAGMLLLTGTNSLSGGLVAAGGLISVASDALLGASSAPFAFNGGGLQVTGTSFNAWSASRALTFPGAATFDIVAEANTFTVGVPAFTAGGLTKQGLGSLSFANAITLGTSPLVVKAGVLRVGADIALTSTANDFVIGNTVLAPGMGGAVLNQSSGTVSITGTDVETAQIGSGIGAFGAYVLSGGAYAGTRVSVGAAGSTGMLTVLNGATFSTVNYLIGGRGATATASFTLAGGTVNQVSTGNTGAWGGGRFEMNIGPNLGGANVGGTFNRGTSAFNVTGSTSTSFGVLNLNGGTLNAGSVSSIAITAGGGAFLNFNGGTLKATAASATFLNSALTSAYVHAGGGTIDNGGFAITLVKALDAPAGAGVASISLTGGTGYFTAPYVKLTGGGGNNDATAGALIDGSGTLTGILITNPGTGYVSAPTVTLVGGTHGTAATATATLNAGNVSGGMIFQGAGTTTLSTANTYAGTTMLSAGVIGIGVNSAFLGGAVLNGPFGTGQVTVAAGVTLDPGTLSNRTLAAAGFTFNGDVTIGTATTTTRLMFGAPLGLSGGTRTFTLLRNGSAADQIISGNEAFKLMQQTDGPAVAVSNGTLRVAADATVTSTFVAANFDAINGVPIAFSGNAGLTLGPRVLGIIRADNPFGTSSASVPRLTLEAGSYYSLSSGATASYDTTVFSLAGAGTLTNLDSNGGVGTLTVAGSATTTFSGVIADGVEVNADLSLTLPVGSVVRLAHAGSGTLTLTGANTYTGATTLTGGIVGVASLGDGVNASSLGKSALTAGNLVIGGGALRYDGSGETSARGLTATGAVTLNAAGTGALVFASAAKIAFADDAPASRILTLTGANTDANVFGFGHDDLAEPAASVFSRLVKNGVGVWIVSAPDTEFRADAFTDISQGILGFASGSLGSVASPHTGLIQVAHGATLRWESGNTDDVSARLSIPASAQATLDVGANQVFFAAAPAVASGGSVRKVGSGNLTLASTSLGSATYAVAQGRLTVNGSAGAISIASGGELGGVGSVGAISVAPGGGLSPGSSAGALSGASVSLAGGSVWTWELRDRAAGQGAGYDFLAVAGNLDLSGASSSNRITLKVVSLGAGNVVGGTPDNFNLSSSLQFINIASVGGTVTGLGAGVNISDVFQFDTSQFVYANGSASNAGLWAINWDSGNHLITLTAVPEPSTYGIGLGALALAAAAIRRRKRQEKKA